MKIAKATKAERKKFEEYVALMRSANMEPSFSLEQWLVNYRMNQEPRRAPEADPTPPIPQTE